MYMALNILETNGKPNILPLVAFGNCQRFSGGVFRAGMSVAGRA